MGGGQEGGLRSGTENTFGIYVFSAAIEKFSKHREEYISHMLMLREHFYSELCKIDGVIDLCPKENFAPHLINIAIDGMRGEVLLHLLEKEGIAISTGSACSSKKKKQSRIHAHLKLPRETEEGIIRISLCHCNTVEEADRTIEAINAALKKYRRYVRR